MGRDARTGHRLPRCAKVGAEMVLMEIALEVGEISKALRLAWEQG
ncbi:MAG: hypothetical protein O7C61_10710 [SAR324 cluster bacterium]|nr:hypothetical protein [SAR324 cluster bacterium]